MNWDLFILAAAWIITMILLVIFTPRDKIREAALIFLFKQTITWSVGLVVVELRLIEYPAREFSLATRTSFTFEYFVYPALCVIFNLHYPEGKSFFRQFAHFFYYCSSMTLIEMLIERYTNIIRYIHWSWYTTWITLFMTFFASRHFYKWFFRLKAYKK